MTKKATTAKKATPAKKAAPAKKGEIEALQARAAADLNRETLMQRRAEEAEALTPEEAHRSVSNRAAVTESKAFEPAYGELGRKDAPASGKVREVVGERPKAAPKKPRAAAKDEVELDAWWGSFGSDEERALLRSGELRTRVVIGTDERVEVTSTEAYPWRCICSLRMRTRDGSNYIGTGWLVSPRLVITAGHCVYFHDHGGWADTIEVIPGRRGSNQPYGSAVSRQFRTVSAWVNNGSRDYDYGAIILPEDARYGDQLGWLGYASKTDDELENGMVNISGYPGDKPSGTQWFNAQRLQSVDEKVITYPVDTAGGQSGAPVWQLFDNGHRYGVGVHTNGHVSGNSATRVTSEVFQNFTNWVSQAP